MHATSLCMHQDCVGAVTATQSGMFHQLPELNMAELVHHMLQRLPVVLGKPSRTPEQAASLSSRVLVAEAYVWPLLSALQGRKYILKVLEQAAIRSKESIRAGKEPSCLLDFWTQQILTECDEAAAAGVPPPKYSHNKEMAYTVMDFLFASQVSC